MQALHVWHWAGHCATLLQRGLQQNGPLPPRHDAQQKTLETEEWAGGRPHRVGDALLKDLQPAEGRIDL